MCHRIMMTRMTGADVLCSEQYPSTSYARVLPRSCYSNNQTAAPHSRAAINNQSSAIFPIDALPMEIHLRILQNLSRPDLDNCSLVCRQWASVIKRNVARLPKHQINSLTLEADKHSFTLTIKTNTFVKQWKRCNNEEVGESPRRIIPGCKRHICDYQRNEQPPSKLSSMLFYFDSHSTDASSLTQPHHQLSSSSSSSSSSTSSLCAIPFELNRTESDTERIQRKHRLHTPPGELLDRIVDCINRADVSTFRIDDMRFTDEFCDEFAHRIGNTHQTTTIQCDALKIEFCKLNYISPQKFSKFISMFKTSSITMAWIRGNNGHTTMPSIVELMCNHCKTVDLCSITSQPSSSSSSPSPHDNSFLRAFLRNSMCEKILRLDDCCISNDAIIDAIKDWKSSPTLLFRNICLSSDAIDLNAIVSSFCMDGSIDLEMCHLVKHPILPNCLKIWRDEEGIHLVNAKIQPVVSS